MTLPAQYEEMTVAQLRRAWDATTTEYLELKNQERTLRQNVAEYDFRKERIIMRKLIANAQDRKIIKQIVEARK